MNQGVGVNRKLFWKEVGKVNRVKVESSNLTMEGNGRLAVEEDEVRMIWKDYFEDLYNKYTEEQIAIHLCGFDSVQSANYFGGESRRIEVEVKVGKLKTGKLHIRMKSLERLKGGGKMVVDWIWRLDNMTFERGVVPVNLL